jgi:hypothetical protein
MVKIHQKFENPLVENIHDKISFEIDRLDLALPQSGGPKVAVACSSRGIADYAAIVGSTVNRLKRLHLKPIIIPAMGSHGGGSAEGQLQVLAEAGITEESMGVPVMSSLKTSPVGVTEDQLPVFIDKFACEADYVVPVNRIKAHTMFSGEIESGLMKMLAIGLGNKKGPGLYHKAAFNLGFEHVIRTVARTVMSVVKILFGVAVIENGYCRPARIGVFESDQIEAMEKRYLLEAKRLEARLPLNEIDLLIVDEMGKDISGAGIDCNVVGRIDMPLLTENPPDPSIKRIVVCDLTQKSEGNAIGVGLADFITRKLADKIDMDAMYVNAMAASDPEHVRIPMILTNDRQAIDAAISTIGMIQPESLKIVRIQNTKQLDEIIVSEPCLEVLAGNPKITAVSEPFQLGFDADGQIEPFKASGKK